MIAPGQDEVARIITAHKPGLQHMAGLLAKHFVASLDGGYLPVLRAADREPLEKAQKAADQLLSQLNRMGPDALQDVAGRFLTLRAAEGLSCDPHRLKCQVEAMVEALKIAGQDVKRRKMRPDTNTDGIAVALAAWAAWDEGEEDREDINRDGRRRRMPDGLREGSPFLSFLGDLLGVCGIEQEKALTVYRAALDYLKNHT